jgi:HEAT repeat protein
MNKNRSQNKQFDGTTNTLPVNSTFCREDEMKSAFTLCLIIAMPVVCFGTNQAPEQRVDEYHEESSGVMKPATSVVSKLSTILQSRKYDDTRYKCTPLLEEIGEREPISFLLEQFHSDDRVRRLSAAFFLELLGDKRGIPVIIKELKDKSYRPTTMTKRNGTEFQAVQVMIDHAYAVRLMGVLGDARALPSLIEATSYKAIDHDVAKSLGQIGDKSAIPALRVMMNAYSDDVRARSSVGYGLAMLGDSEGLEVVIGTLTDLQVPRAIRRRAIEFLADLGNKKAGPHLIVALKDEHQDIRVNAARALGKIGNVSSLPAVEEVLKELLWKGSGPPAEGVQGMLWAKHTHWPINEIPQVTATIQNQGIRDLAVYRSPDLCELSVDGQWYERTGSTGVKSSSFPPGKHYTGVLIPLDRSWRHKTTNQPLKLSKGRHEILVAFTAKPTQEEPGPDVRFVSNSVEIEVHPASNKALVWGEESNGLRSAIEFVPEKESYSIGYLVEIRLHIQNVSDKEIRIARETGHPEYLGKWAVEDSNGGGIRCGLSGGKWHGPGGADRRILGHGQETVFDFDSVGLGNPTGDGFPRCESLARIEKPGSYSFRYKLRFEEKADGDWSGDVETGKREIVIGVVETVDRRRRVTDVIPIPGTRPHRIRCGAPTDSESASVKVSLWTQEPRLHLPLLAHQENLLEKNGKK